MFIQMIFHFKENSISSSPFKINKYINDDDVNKKQYKGNS